MSNSNFVCEFCGKSLNTSQGLQGHRYRSHINVAKQQENSDKAARMFKNGEIERGFKKGEYKHSAEMLDKLSVLACSRLQKNSKYSKNTEYKCGVILESSYEVRFAEILDELGILWEKVRRGYVWNDNGKQRRYVPDFYLPDYDLFVDPKNDYLIKKDKNKIDSAVELNSINVIVLANDQINKEYVSRMLG